jgi:hypothetical protein
MDVLFVTVADFKRYTPIGGNVDEDKIIPHIKVTQDTVVLQIIGTQLFQKIANDILANTITGDYETLLNEFIRYVVIHYSAANFYKFHPYDIGNAGITKHQGDTTVTVDKSEVDTLVATQSAIADNYRKRLIDHLVYYSSRYPEFTAAQKDGVWPSGERQSSQWVL